MYIQEILIFLEKHILLGSTWILLLIIVVYTTIGDCLIKSSAISCDKAVFLINKKNATVIDIRNKNDYYSGHIINSINISIEKIKSNNIHELMKIKQNPLIIVYNNNITAYTIKRHLYTLGFQTIYILQGGINNWKINNLPISLEKKYKN